MPCRFFVMIWFDATQSDQPEITWMSSETALPFGSISLLPLYVNPASVSSFFAAVGLYVDERLRPCLDLRVGDPAREEPVQADRVGRRRVAVLTELRHGVAVDRHRQRVTERDEAVRVLVVVEHERDRVGRRRVEGVEVRLVLRLVRLVDVRDEVVRPVDLPALDQREGRVVRRSLHVLEAADQRLARLPVARVLREHVVLRREARDPRERAGADRVRVRERRGVLDLRPDVLRDHDHAVERRCDELRVGRLQVDHDGVRALRLDRGDVRLGAGDAEDVHHLVLAAGERGCRRRR